MRSTFKISCGPERPLADQFVQGIIRSIEIAHAFGKEGKELTELNCMQGMDHMQTSPFIINMKFGSKNDSKNTDTTESSIEIAYEPNLSDSWD